MKAPRTVTQRVVFEDMEGRQMLSAAGLVTPAAVVQPYHHNGASAQGTYLGTLKTALGSYPLTVVLTQLSTHGSAVGTVQLDKHVRGHGIYVYNYTGQFDRLGNFTFTWSGRSMAGAMSGVLSGTKLNGAWRLRSNGHVETGTFSVTLQQTQTTTPTG